MAIQKISNAVLGTGSVNATSIAAGEVSTAKIADDAVTEDKLANAINSAIAANTAKTGITSAQASAIVANTAKVTGGPSLGTASIIRTNADTISENITIPANTNGMTAGPVTIADGYTVTLNGTWSIV